LGLGEEKIKGVLVFMLTLEAAMLGVFRGARPVPLYIFWDAMLIPITS